MKIVYHKTEANHISPIQIPSEAHLSGSYSSLKECFYTIPNNTQVTLCNCIAVEMGIVAMDEHNLQPFTWSDGKLLYTVEIDV